MRIAADVAVAIVALLHLLFLWLEMFQWTKPRGRKVFGLTAELAEQTKALAANQGLYNGFLAAGLIWGLVQGPVWGFAPRVFFTSCVVVAGLFGAATAKRSILYVQALPGAIALALTLLAEWYLTL